MRNEKDDIRIHCGAIEAYVPEPIVECSDYENKHTMTEYDMQKIAWIVNPVRKIGFHQDVEFIPPGDERHKKLTRDY